jgi:CRISPR-associated endonuclease/helicase Cas3
LHGEPTTFWGKIERSDDGAACRWHPLLDHCADVGAVAETLIQLPVWRRRLTRLAGADLGESGWARLCVLATLHDLGKLNLGFQAKGRRDLGTTAGHVEEALAALCRPDALPALEVLCEWGEGAESLLVAAICHHGRPHDVKAVTDKWQATWWRPRQGLDPPSGAAALLQRCRTWFPLAFDDAAPLPDVPELTHAFAGVVMLADWLGSDTRFFPFSDSDDERMPFARRRARHAIAALGLDVPADARLDEAARDAFTRVAPSGYQPRAAQRAVLRLPSGENGSITIVEADTGSGKTEAALARFVELFEAGLVDGLYFALPTRTAATQIHQRVLAAARRAFAHPPAVVLAVPGYLRVDDVEGERLAPFDVLWPDHDRFRSRAWAAESAKRFLVGSIVVGTVDQVLLSSLMVGHAHLRAAALLRHLLVVDEVHASDAYMERVLQDVLARHVGAGGHALLLSATLGSEARTRLLHPGETSAPPSLDQALAAPYPLVTHRSGAVQAASVTPDGPQRSIGITAEPWLETADALVQRALAAALLGAKVLVIRNTVRDCVATQLRLEAAAGACGRHDVLFTCGGVAAPHHARFARPDRAALDLALDRRLGKERADGGCGCIVVATQTVQQSLDVDADLLITDLCPADVLLQRLGRLHRHARVRPPGFETPRAVVAVPAKRDLGALLGENGRARNHHGLGSVYSDLRILEATWRLIEAHPHWRVPDMNRLLVERSLHSEVLGAIVRDAGPRWREHANSMLGIERAQARQADLNLVDWSRSYAEMSFPSDLRIPTRLGEDDRRVRFAPPIPGAFGEAVTEVTLAAWWMLDISSELEPERVVSRARVTRFELGPKAFLYDRLGLRPEARTSEEDADDDGP